MLNVDLEMWVEDFRQLGREYFALVRNVIGEDAPLAATLFGFRRPEAMYLLFRMKSEQLDNALRYGGLPFGIADEAALHADLRNLDGAKPRFELPSQLATVAESIQMAYYERFRTVARHNPAEAASLFGLADLHRVVAPISHLTFGGLRKLSRLNHALAIHTTIADELMWSFVSTGASADRVAIAGCSTIAIRGQADLSLTGKIDAKAFLSSDKPDHAEFEV